jgi:hypothetical protein
MCMQTRCPCLSEPTAFLFTLPRSADANAVPQVLKSRFGKANVSSRVLGMYNGNFYIGEAGMYSDSCICENNVK